MTLWACATDTDSIRSLGLDVWESYPGWPTSDAVFGLVCAALSTAYDRVRAKLPEDGRLALDALDPDRTMIARAVDMRLAYLETMRRNGSFLRRGVIFEPAPLATELFATSLGADWLPSDAISQLARRVAKRWVFNRHLAVSSHLQAFMFGAPSILIGSMSSLIAADLASREMAVDAIPASTFLASPDRVAIQTNIDFVDMFEASLREVDGAIQDATGFDVFVSSLAPRLATRLETSQVLMARAATRLPRRLKTLYAGESGKVPQRIVAAAARRNGAEVVTVNHGFYAGETSLDDVVGTQHLLSSRVVAYNTVNAARLKANYSSSRAAVLNPASFAAAGCFDGMAPVMRTRNSFRQGPIRSVMIVGYPMNQTRYPQCAGHFFTFQLSAERTLARVFRSIGLRVIYKVHPERVVEAAGLFEDCVDEVRGGRFEGHIDTVDAFAFASHLTTTLNFAIASGKPCLVLDIPGMVWTPGARETLSRAVRFIPAQFDELGHLRPIFGAVEDALLDETPLDTESYIRTFIG